MISYTKLRSGNWGLRSTSQLTPGASVQVTKRDGSINTALVGSLVWSGNGVWLYESGSSSASSSRSSGSGRRGYGSGRCRECGTTLERWMDGYSAGLCHDCI